MNTLLNSSPLYHMKPVLSVSASSSASSWTPLALSLSNGICKSSIRKQQTKEIVARQVGNLKIGRRIRSRSTVQCVVPAAERMMAAVGYVLPFFNGLQYGRSLLMQYPRVGMVLEPLAPLLEVYQSIPYASFVAFFALYLGVVRNPRFSRYVRFNAMQAVVVDVMLALPMIFQRILSPRRGPIFNLFMLAYNALFLCIAFGFVYAVASCVLGTTPKIPFVADAVDAQLDAQL